MFKDMRLNKLEMKPFAISTLDDIADGFFHARVLDLPESKPCWQEIKKDKAFGSGMILTAARCKCGENR